METLETRCAGILQFLKEENYATDEQLAPFMEQAANASNVRWRAARLRMTSLLHSAMKDMETSGRKVEPSLKHAEPAKEEGRASGASKDEVGAEPAQEAATKNSSAEAGAGTKTDSAQPNAPTKGEISKPDNSPKGSGVKQTAAAQPHTLQSRDKPAESNGVVTPEPESAQSPDVEQKSGKAEKQPEAPKKPGKQNAA
jgi:hypothetical protein